MPAKKYNKSDFKESHSKETLTKKIIGVLEKYITRTFNYKQIASLLHITNPTEQRLINEILDNLCEKGLIEQVHRGKFKLNALPPYINGTVSIKPNGTVTVFCEEMNEEIHISPKMVNGALHGDKAKVYVFKNRKGHYLEGEIIEVLTRAQKDVVGIIQVSKRFAFVVPSSSKINFDIFIPIENLNGASDGQKVIAQITDWPSGSKNPFGKVIDVLGEPGNNNVEMHAILAEFDLPYSFPEKLEELASKIPDQITPEEIAKRRDFRTILTFTIDPVDAKDFDDALSIKKLENGNWEIGVHIADVSHYVSEGSPIDLEAYERATSVYLVDRVVPMLPEKLSNLVCSLRPNEEKLCFSAVFELDKNANILNEWFGKTIINSNRRFTYEEAQKIIETKDGDYADELNTLNDLAVKLRENRMKKGSVDFSTTEVKFHLDEKGNPTGVYFKEQKDSNKLIEDFMLLANRKVAELVGSIKTEKKEKLTASHKPFVYRIHDSPDPDKINNFSKFVGKFGYRLSTKSDVQILNSLNKLIKDVEGKREQNLISQLAIRTMAKAIYTTKNIGHYGLGFEYYTHFTSPIRRYPDLMVHRLLSQHLSKKTSKTEDLEEKCKHSSEMEKKAADAERASIKYKQAQYLEKQIGNTFEGLISGVTEWGIFVEIIENKCEGMIRLKDLDDDFYTYDEENYCVVGKRTKRKLQLGDKVAIKVKRVDLLKKQIDFQIIDRDYF
jgi:ribonuclease R